MLVAEAVGVSAVLLVLSACGGDGRSAPRATGAVVTPLAATATPAGSAAPSPLVSRPATGGPSTNYPAARPPFSEPRLVALAEARAQCQFDWRQSLAARLVAAGRFVTTAYARTMAATPADLAAWARTRQDRAPASVRFVRVALRQRVSLPGHEPTIQPFAALYRVERQFDGRWLVAGNGSGG
jgi:hypothetical protein